MRDLARGVIVTLALATALQLILVRDASAYLDPGTGSFIFQTVVAMVLGAAFTVRHYWARVKSVFGSKPPPERAADDEKGGPS